MPDIIPGQPSVHDTGGSAGSDELEKMVRTISTRQVIGRAEGILMERHKVTGDQAFAMLVRASQHSNLKLRDVADRLIHRGDLDGRPDRRV